MNGLPGESQDGFSSSMSFLNPSAYSKRFDSTKKISIISDVPQTVDAEPVASGSCASEVVDATYSESPTQGLVDEYDADYNQYEDAGRSPREVDCQSYRSKEEYHSQSQRSYNEDECDRDPTPSRGPRTMSVGLVLLSDL